MKCQKSTSAKKEFSANESYIFDIMNSEWQSAANSGSVEQLKRLLTNNDINSLNRYNQTASMIAAYKGHTDLVRLLVENGAKLDHTAKYTASELLR